MTDPKTVWFESAKPIEVDGAPSLSSFIGALDPQAP